MYKWYDSLKEPKRSLIFLIPTLLLIVGVYTPILSVQLICGTVLIVMLISRIFYIHK